MTPREIEILALMVKGLVARAIAARLNVSTATVRSHIQHIFKKLRVHSKLEAVVSALRLNLIKINSYP